MFEHLMELLLERIPDQVIFHCPCISMESHVLPIPFLGDSCPCCVLLFVDATQADSPREPGPVFLWILQGTCSCLHPRLCHSLIHSLLLMKVSPTRFSPVQSPTDVPAHPHSWTHSHIAHKQTVNLCQILSICLQQSIHCLSIFESVLDGRSPAALCTRRTRSSAQEFSVSCWHMHLPV